MDRPCTILDVHKRQNFKIPVIFCKELKDSNSRCRKKQRLKLLIENLCLVNSKHPCNFVSFFKTSKLREIIEVFKVSEISPTFVKANKFKSNMICTCDDGVALSALGAVRRKILIIMFQIVFNAVHFLVSYGFRDQLSGQNSQFAVKFEGSFKPFKLGFIRQIGEVWEMLRRMTKFEYENVFPKFLSDARNHMSGFPYLFVHHGKEHESFHVQKLEKNA